MKASIKYFILFVFAALITVGTCILLSNSANYSGLVSKSDVPYREVISTEDTSHVMTPEIMAAIMAIEGDVVLPRNAKAKEAYTRFYALDIEGPPLFIRGVFVFPTIERSSLYGAPGYKNEKFISEFIQKNTSQATFIPIPKISNAYFVKFKNLPSIMDGGCSVVTVEYDLTKKMLLWTKEALHHLGQGKVEERIVHGFCNGHA